MCLTDFMEIHSLMVGIIDSACELFPHGHADCFGRGTQVHTYIPRVPQCLSPRWNWDPPLSCKLAYDAWTFS